MWKSCILKMRWHVPWKRGYWLRLSVVSSMSVLILISYAAKGWSKAQLTVPGCSHNFLLNEVVYPWEQLWTEATRSCGGGYPNREPIQSRLHRTKAALGHTPRLAIIGDSRGRAVYVNIMNVTGPTEPVWQRQSKTGNQAKLQVKFALFSPGMEPHDFCSAGMCSSNATYDSIEIQYFWRPFVDRHLSETLRTFAAECGAPRRQCPDMVLMNSGFWYSSRVPYMFQFGQHVQLLMFRRGLLQLVSPLSQLARRTRTVWKLEEAVLFEFVQDKYEETLTKSDYMQLIMVQHALAYELTLQIPELVIWSSLLPEVTRHIFRVCAPTRPRGWRECPDAVHMGKALQDRFSDRLLSDLCDRALSGALL